MRWKLEREQFRSSQVEDTYIHNQLLMIGNHYISDDSAYEVLRRSSVMFNFVDRENGERSSSFFI